MDCEGHVSIQSAEFLRNPSLVIAAVATELEENSEAFRNEVQSAETTLAELFGVPTELAVVVVGTFEDGTEAIESADMIIVETIAATLEVSMPSSEVVHYTVVCKNPDRVFD